MSELCVDNFAGGGGASLGIEKALGRPVDYAINHDREAIAMHKANHPYTEHLTEDVWHVNPSALLQGRPVGVGWFSPDCTYYSKARGGRPFRDPNLARRVRGLAAVVIRWAKLPKDLRPRLIILENVEEFQKWGPLLADGTPDPQRAGLSFRRWWGRLRNLGYQIEMRELRASPYGAPTSRKRLFIILRCDGEPIVWPAGEFGPLLKPFRTAADCVDWTLPIPSIFLSKDQAKIWEKVHGWRPRRPLADATMRRIARGVMRYVVNNPRPFIVPLTHQGSDRVHSIDEPFRTVTGAHRGELALVSPTLIQTGWGEREGQAPRCLDLHQPLGTIMATGNKHALVAAFLAKHYGGHENDGAPLYDPFDTITARDHHALITAHVQRDFGNSIGQQIDLPLGAITSKGGGKAALLTSHVIKLKGTCRDGQPMDQPLDTIQAGGLHYGRVHAFLTKYYGTEQDPRLELPLDTITTKDRFGLVSVYGEPYAIVDIGMRMFSPRELFRAQGFDEDYIIDPLVETEEGSGIFKPLTSTAQVRMCGNSVSPPVAEALVAANYREGRIEIAA